MKKIEIEIPEGKEVVDWGLEGGQIVRCRIRF